MKKIKSILKNFPRLYKFMSEINYFRIYRKHKEIFKKSPEDLIKHIYYKYHNRNLDLNNPKAFNEKLQWLKLYWFDERAIMCCDKYLVREFVKEKKLDYILNNLEGEGIYNSPDEINIDDLPEKFVLKTTHDSGHIVLCTDKSSLKWGKIFKKMKRWLNVNYGYMSGEWPYSAVKPQIICESYLTDASSKDLIDYKIFCFNGKPEYIQVD